MDQLTDWNEAKPVEAPDDDVFVVDVAGYEGPLDLLLDLARRQKVDLAHVSVLQLAEQYLEFIGTIRDKRIEIAADYLVMAAWLAYLKSRLMVPGPAPDDEASGEMMAALLQFRLKRLEAMRKAAGDLLRRTQLGRGIFSRGDPDLPEIARKNIWEANLYDLLKAYADQRQKSIPNDYTPIARHVLALSEARQILERLIGESVDWVPFERFLVQFISDPAERVSAMASSFSAGLELVREGHIEMRQSVAFGPLLMRRRTEKQ